MLDPEYWNKVQNNFNNKVRPHICPYREENRFKQQYAGKS